MKIDPNGPAHPHPTKGPPAEYSRHGPTSIPYLGLPIRLHLAAMAMQGMLTGAVGYIGNSKDPTAYAKGPCNAVIVERALVIADALIAEFNKEEK